MSKRAADRQITQDILDKEEEPEDAGQFEKASQSELEGRVFKRARRTLPATAAPATDQSDFGRGLFSGIRLTGSLTQQNGLSQGTGRPLFPASQPLAHSGLPGLKVPSSLPPSLSPSLPPSLTGTGPQSGSTTVPKPAFLSELSNLNTSVNEWIGKHVRENPYVDLTPIFRDYEKHLRELDRKFQTESSTTSEGVDMGSEVITRSDSSGTDVKTYSQSSSEREGESGGEGGGERTDEEVMEEKTTQKTPAADEEDEGALFSERAKLFFKRSSDTEFTELGIGRMRVLPGNREGVKAIMRNDTALAKVLLNVRVTSAIPVSSKSNNVFLVCVPNPPLERKAVQEEAGPSTVTYLIRVKTVTMATRLQQALRGSSSDV